MTSPTGPDIEGLTFVRHLGAGGYADVYLYERRSPRMNVAVKVLGAGRLSPAELAQFEAEAETMAELADHPHIVQVFSADRTAEGRPYLVMKYYPKDNLAKRAAVERFSVAEVLRIGVKISSAVETAHRAGILHRDVKPANILGSQYGEPGLTDFGIAGRAAETDDGDEVGVSIPWTSPEVLSGASNGSAQSDVYSLAATIWNLLVGRSPFEIPHGDNSAAALMQRVLTMQPPDTGRADVPESLNRLLKQAMSKDPALRPRTALEFAQALQAVEQEQRFGRTELVVEGFGHAGERRATTTSDGEDATRMRAQRVIAQPAAATAPPRTASAPSDPQTVDRPELIRSLPRRDIGPQSRERVMPSGEASPSTMRRVELAGPEPDVPVRTRRRGVRPRTAVLLASGVAVVAVAAGVILTSGGGGTHDDVVPSTTPTGQTDVPELAVAPPDVVATYNMASKTVTFRWHSAQAQTGDTYVWFLADSPQQTNRTSATTVGLTSLTPATTCIRVSLVRTDGSSSTASDPVCGP